MSSSMVEEQSTSMLSSDNLVARYMRSCDNNANNISETTTSNSNKINNNSSNNNNNSITDVKRDNQNETNLIVNYLPQNMTQEDIHSLFITFGELESSKLIKEKHTGQSLGYAFVNYIRKEDAEKAIISLNGLRLQNKTIKVSLARPSSESIKGANLYVSGLSKNITQQDLEKIFSPYGKIITSRILCDNVTGLSKGVGFIRFDQRHEADRAIKELNGTVPPNATDTITVKFANNPSMKMVLPPIPTAPPQQLLLHSVQRGRGFPLLSSSAASLNTNANFGNSRAVLARYQGLTSKLDNGSVLANATNPNGIAIFIFNLPPETEENVLWQLFGPFGAVQGVKVVRDSVQNKCKGYGFVTMTNYEEAFMAIKALNGYNLGSRVLQVSFKAPKKQSS